MDLTSEYIAGIAEVRRRSTPEYLEAQQIDNQKLAEKEEATMQRTDEYLKNSDLATTGPRRDEYDYRGLVASGSSVMPDEQKGVRLPNQFRFPYSVTVGGYDLTTGDKMLDVVKQRQELAVEGVAQLRDSYHDTKAGSPVEDIRGLSRIAYSVIEQGGGYADFADEIPDMWSDGHKRMAFKSAQNAMLRSDLENFYREESKEPSFEYEQASGESIDPVTLPENENWLTAAKTVYEEIKGEKFQGTNEDLTNWAQWQMSLFNWNVVAQSAYTVRALFGSSQFKQAIVDMIDMYDRVEVTPGSFGRAVVGIALDPSTYLGIGVGKLASKASALAAKSALKKLLVSSVAGATLEGSVFGTLDEFLRQTVEKEGGKREQYDKGDIAATGVMSGGFGLVLGGLGSEPVAKFSKSMIDKAQGLWRKTGPDRLSITMAQQMELAQ